MKKIAILTLGLSLFANAHFLTFLSNTDNVTDQKQTKIDFDISFIHPFEQSGMNMEKPEAFVNNKNNKLVLKETKKFEHKAWNSSYEIKTPGVYKFFVQPQPYFEPAEEKFISHVPKLIVSSFGLEDGWDEPLGLKYEIIPMTKPFALYAGNLFQGKVLQNGKPAINTEVEVELYNEFGLKAPSDAHITQVVKTDDNGVFSFVMNHKGWWGFAALIEEGELKHSDGKMYPVENGALIWVKAY
jgi:cobalt/nickel transport protein